MSDRQETYIYESPDGGDTVYRRMIGAAPDQRELHARSQKAIDTEKKLNHHKLWGRIHHDAESDPVLKDMLERIEVYYQLKNSP